MPLIPALREAEAGGSDFCEFEASLIYRVNSRTVRDTQRNRVLKNKTTTTKGVCLPPPWCEKEEI